MSKKSQSSEPIVIKKYANRRLYNTDTSSYVTLDDLCTMVKEGAEFIVYDAKSGEDLTRQILTQVIFEQESSGEHLLPTNFLRSIIGFYDNSLKEFVPHYLESTMKTFQGNQEKMREMMGMGTMGSFGQVAQQLEEIGKQNMEMFTKAFSMFTPFVEPTNTTTKKSGK
jgi:polyhydroxyalkanoate synthesis repressor PhaR